MIREHSPIEICSENEVDKYMAKSKSVASRGFVNDTILECLIAGDKYGYEIIKEVEEKTNGKVVLKQPSLYSSLRRFESKGYISSYWGDSDIGGRRHYYSITETGRKHFNEGKSDNDDDNEIVEEIEEEIDQVEMEIPSTPSYEIDEETDIEDSIPVVSDSYVNSFRDFGFEEKVNELIGAEPEESEEKEIKQPFNLYNTVNKPEDDLEYIREQEDAKEQDEPIEEEPETEEKVYFQNGEVVEHVDLEKTPVALSEHQFIQEDLFKPSVTESVQEKEETLENTNVVLNEEANVSNKKIDSPIPMIEEEEDSFDLDQLRKKALENTESFSKTEFYESPLKQELDKKRNEEYLQQDMFGAPVQKQYNVITDEDGITKAASDAINTHREQKIFDNVGVRMSPQKTYIPLGSDEEEKEKPFIEESKDEVEEAKEINYKQILGDLYENDEEKVEHNIIKNPFEKAEIEEEEEFEEDIPVVRRNVVNSPEELTIRPYTPNINKGKEYDFILYNKARATLAFFLTIFALIQMSIFFIIIKTKNALTLTDSIMFIVCLSLAGLSLIGFVLPWFLRPGRRKLQKFNFGLNLLFCSLAFLAIAVVIYAINSFLGLDVNNISKHLSTLLLPIILAFNIVIAPIIYKLITLKKDMY